VYNACVSEQMFRVRPAVSRTPQVLLEECVLPVCNACVSEQMFRARPAVSRTPQVLFRGVCVTCV